MAATAFSVVLNDIDEKIDSITRAMADGAAKEFSEYKGMAGEIRGLSIARMLITDLVRKLEHDDE